MSLKYTTKSYKHKIERQKAVSKYATKAGLNLKDARIYFKMGLTPSEAKKVNNLVNKGLGVKFKNVETINQLFGLKIKEKEINKKVDKITMAKFLKDNKDTGIKSKDVFYNFKHTATWNPNWSSKHASMNNIKVLLQESGKFRQFSGIMLKHRGMNEEWNPEHCEYNGHGSDSHGQFVQYTYTSYKNGQPYRKCIIKIYQSSSDVETEYFDLMTGVEI